MTADRVPRPTGVYGYTLDVERDLTRLRSGAGPRGVARVRFTDEDLLEQRQETLQFTRDETDGEPLLSLARAPGALLVWCRSAGSARIEVATGTITCRTEGDLDSWEDRLLNLFVPVLLAGRGELILHGAAVRTPAGAVVFCGPSGRGKSTLTAALGTLGLPVLAEDAVSLTAGPDGILVWPGPTGVRLDAATAGRLRVPVRAQARGKKLYLPAQPDVNAQPVALATIAVIEPRGGRAPRVRPLGASAAVAELFSNLFRLEPAGWPRLLGATAQIVDTANCYLVRLPDDLDAVSRFASPLLAELTPRRARSAA